MAEEKKPARFAELEGLRGIAAVSVALYHNLLGFFMMAFFGTSVAVGAVQHAKFEQYAYGNPLMVFVSGTFAVAIFFVLSGFVLSIGFFQTGRDDVVKSLAIRRYPRLMIPALVSTVLCVVLFLLGLSQVGAAYDVTKSGWLATTWNAPLGLLDALRSGAIGIFTEGQSAYNNVLWTMTIEFVGSFLVFALLLIAGKIRHRWILYAFLSIITFGTWYLCFVIGVVLADLYANRVRSTYHHRWYVTALLLLSTVYFGGYPLLSPAGGYYEWLSPLAQNFGVSKFIPFLTLGATSAVILALWSQSATKLFRSKFLSRLGKYTFSLYLVHIPILYTFTYWVFLRLQAHHSYTRSALVAITVSVPVVALVTYLFERFVDAPATRFAAKCSRVFFGQERFSSAELRRRMIALGEFIKATTVGRIESTQQVERYSLKADQEEI